MSFIKCEKVFAKIFLFFSFSHSVWKYLHFDRKQINMLDRSVNPRLHDRKYAKCYVAALKSYLLSLKQNEKKFFWHYTRDITYMFTNFNSSAIRFLYRPVVVQISNFFALKREILGVINSVNFRGALLKKYIKYNFVLYFFTYFYNFS